MANCSCCGEELRGVEGKVCQLCTAKMVNYAKGEHDDDNDPAVELLKKTVEERRRRFLG